MNGQLPVLVKREFWEHRSLWMAPLVAASFLILIVLVGSLLAPGHVHFNGPVRVDDRGGSPMMLLSMGPSGLVLLVSLITCFTYLLDCLYSERKDRSILFWKSLPVSDAHTVLTKFAVGMVIVPLAAFVLAIITHLVIMGIVSMTLARLAPMPGDLHAGNWFEMLADVSGMLVATLLWYAPVASWLMLASVAARRAAILIASLPLVALGVTESLVLQTSHVWRFLGHRMTPQPDLGQALQLPAMWGGLAVAAGMLYIVIRLRRYRDDT
jgi:ABC-2 type transport system permease protein